MIFRTQQEHSRQAARRVAIVGAVLLGVVALMGGVMAWNGLEEGELFSLLFILGFLVPLCAGVVFYLRPWAIREFHLEGRRLFERGEKWMMDLGAIEEALDHPMGLYLRRPDGFAAVIPLTIEHFDEFREAALHVIRNPDQYPAPASVAAGSVLDEVYARTQRTETGLSAELRTPFETAAIGLAGLCLWILFLLGAVVGFESVRGRPAPEDRLMRTVQPFASVGAAACVLAASMRLFRRKHVFLKGGRYESRLGPLVTSRRSGSAVGLEPVRMISAAASFFSIESGYRILLRSAGSFTVVSRLIQEEWIARSAAAALSAATGLPEDMETLRNKPRWILDPLLPTAILFGAIVGLAGRLS